MKLQLSILNTEQSSIGVCHKDPYTRFVRIVSHFPLPSPAKCISLDVLFPLTLSDFISIHTGFTNRSMLNCHKPGVQQQSVPHLTETDVIAAQHPD